MTKIDFYLDIFALTIAEFFIIDSKKIPTEEMEVSNKFYVESFYKNIINYISKEKRMKKHHKFFNDNKDFEKKISYAFLALLVSIINELHFQNKFQIFFMY